MKRPGFQTIIIVSLLALLGLLAGLQYHWLGQISEGESERLQKRLQTDTERFAADFNREIQTAYFAFQLDADVWREKNFAAFNERFENWQKKSKYPALVKDFYFFRNDEILRFDAENRAFVKTGLTDELTTLRESFSANRFEPVDAKNFLLTLPVYENAERVFVPDTKNPISVKLPDKYGFLAIKLDEQTIKTQILPELIAKYFSDGESANYHLSIVHQTDAANVVFQSPENIEFGNRKADATASLMDLSAENFAMFVKPDLLTNIQGERKQIFINRVESNTSTDEKIIFEGNMNKMPANGELNVIHVQRSNDAPAPYIFERRTLSDGGKLILNVQHTAGSLENYINNTQRKNLAISFGILLLLAASVVFVFISARRAQTLAQRQIDFVSAVSHEFRTPLAVIYSAGENLTDGVVDSKPQVERYGNLIKHEGKKLSQMVEQILEFAGARSGRRKYDLRETDIKIVIEDALSECRSLIEEKNFTVEKEIAENLPLVAADKNALGRAIQNLLANSIKYSNGNAWLKISAQNGGGKIKITIEDKGIGIKPKDLKHIFEPFYRSKSVVDEQIHGSGLGLSLVKEIVEAHGGKVFVRSEIAKGSCFTIELPQKEN